jgi:hypothetical protein
MKRPHSFSTEGIMDRFMKVAALGLVLLLATCGTALAAAPNLLQYQGRLTDNAGVALNGAFNTTFTIYSDSAGTATLWTETRSVTYANGLFSLTLGTGTAIPATVSNGLDRFLGIKVAPDAADMLPRQRLAATVFARRAAEADHATNADLATTATNATNSTNATNATNANHATVADAVTSAPVIVTKQGPFSLSVTAGTSAEVVAVTITVPVAGIINVSGTAMGQLSHVLSTSNYLRYSVSNVTGPPSNGPGTGFLAVIAASPTGSSYSSIACQTTYAVAAGTYTYYLNATAYGETFSVYYSMLTATFAPNGSVSVPASQPARVAMPSGTEDPTRQ